MRRWDDDELSEGDKMMIVAALDILNSIGRPAARFLWDQLELPANADAEAWVAAYFGDN